MYVMTVITKLHKHGKYCYVLKLKKIISKKLLCHIINSTTCIYTWVRKCKWFHYKTQYLHFHKKLIMNIMRFGKQQPHE